MSTPTGEPAYVRFTRLYNRHRFHYEHQEGLCFYCRQPMALPDPTHNHAAPLPPDRVTVEHLITIPERRRMRRAIREQFADVPHLDRPYTFRNSRENIVAACNACNNERGGSIPWQEFLARKLIQRWRPQ